MMERATECVRVGRGDEKASGYVNHPVYHASTYSYATVEEYETALSRTHVYGEEKYARVTTPAILAFEQAMATLERGAAARATSSGLSAISSALLSVVKPGDHILVPTNAYPSTLAFCDRFLAQQMNVIVERYDPSVGPGVGDLFRENSSALYLEAPGSNTFEIPDIRVLTAAASQHGLTTIADNTWAGSHWLHPLELGCDIVVLSASKYICGHADAILGAVVCTQNSFDRVTSTIRLLGQNPAPEAVFLALRGIRTLPVRMKQHHESAMRLAHWFDEQSWIDKVLCPGLQTDPFHDLWSRDFTGVSGLFGLVFADDVDPESIEKYINALALFRPGSSWGGFESLIIPIGPDGYHANHPAASGRLCRIHCGLEDVDDLIKDLEHHAGILMPGSR